MRPRAIGIDAAAPLALRLIAAVDPGGNGFCTPARTDRQLASAAVTRPRLSIVSPSDGENLLLDEESQRRFCLKPILRKEMNSSSGLSTEMQLMLPGGSPLPARTNFAWWMPRTCAVARIMVRSN